MAVVSRTFQSVQSVRWDNGQNQDSCFINVTLLLPVASSQLRMKNADVHLREECSCVGDMHPGERCHIPGAASPDVLRITEQFQTSLRTVPEQSQTTLSVGL